MDSLNQKPRRHEHRLAYRLRASVRCHRLPSGKSTLVLYYPLRSVIIHHTWRPVVDALAKGEWTPLDWIVKAVPQLPGERIEAFLNSLMRKGYVDQEGIPQLSDADCPSVSVIVPVRNRPEEIRACLNSLTRLCYPDDKLEIIVVDDASEDDTPEAVMQFADVRLLRMQQHRQASYCRNRAAEIARGDILAFIDSDCLADATWLKELVPAFGDPSVGALGGWVDAASEENGLDRYEKVKSALKMGAWFKRSRPSDRFFYVPACNFLIRRDTFARLGGFRESFHVGEDVDLCWRLQDAGQSLEYRPSGRVAHKHRNRVAAFCFRRFEYGTSEPALQKLHTGRVKTLYLPWTESLWWLSVILAVVLGSGLPLLPGAGIFIADSAGKYKKLKSSAIPVALHEVCTANMRGYLSFVYHCCSFFSRYYLIALPVLLPMAPFVGAVMAGMHLVAGTVEYFVRKPRLNLLSFVFYFTLEQVSYQSGVWWECMHSANFRPVLPRIVHTRI